MPGDIINFDPSKKKTKRVRPNENSNGDIVRLFPENLKYSLVVVPNIGKPLLLSASQVNLYAIPEDKIQDIVFLIPDPDTEKLVTALEEIPSIVLGEDKDLQREIIARIIIGEYK